MNFSSDPIHTLENLIAKNKTKRISTYIVVVLAIAVLIVLLPVITVDLAVKAVALFVVNQIMCQLLLL